jgi:predicted O-methyltransferase YrrM
LTVAISTDKLVDLTAERFSYEEMSISEDEGRFLKKAIIENGYKETIEIGCALGISSLYICDGLSETGCDCWHTIIDPNQKTTWKSIGIQNLKNAGHDRFTLIEAPSEIALPELLGKKKEFDLAFVDGWHTFDHVLLDFFYLNRLIRVGGMIVFDDASWPPISRALRYVAKYPNYELIESGGPTSVSRKHRAFKLGQNVCRIVGNVVPRKIRSRVLSDYVTDPLTIDDLTLHQRWAAFKKTAEDDRHWDWYEGM